MNKKVREAIFNKYGGKCAYCGCDLLKGWHVDHMTPVVRSVRTEGAGYFHKVTGDPFPNEIPRDERNKIDWDDYERRDGKKVRYMVNPQNHTIENMIASCPSCNIYKHSASIEEFRFMLQNGVKMLERNNPQYRFAK